MSATPRVTIGIPFFDEERHLGAAIRSALAQSFGDFELVLVDDGSSDRSLEVARSFQDPRVTVLSDGRRRRLPARLNEIVARARAPYVARMDADDVMHPERIAREIAVLDADTACDAVGTWAALVDEDDQILAVAESAALPASRAVALERGILSHATMLARRSWLVANPYDESLSRTEDRDLWCRTAATATFRVVPECLYVVRVSPQDDRFLADYVEAQRQSRRLYAKYGPDTVGLLRSARLRAASHAKSVVTSLMLRVGLAEVLLRRRGRPPTPHERSMVEQALAVARQRA